MAGLGAGLSMPLRAFGQLSLSSYVSRMTEDQRRFLGEAGRRYSGTTLRLITEDTPPSRAYRDIALREFPALTGIGVSWELLPLDRIIANIVQDSSSKSGRYDLYYLDHSWLASMADHVYSPARLLMHPDIAYPGFDFPDFIDTLVENVASLDGRLLGIPFDIPILIMVYRKDVLEELGLKPPSTLPEYLHVARAVQESMAPRVFGTVGQWKAGHYALVCDMSAWLWGHGGSFFRNNSIPGFLDVEAAEALHYMLELGTCMPPGATAWDWDGQARCFAQGNAAIAIVWSEHFPMFDDPAVSSIVGLAEPAPCPREIALRPPSQTSFGEKPGISHQGGSCLAISRYGRNLIPAWVFLQWLTSKDVSVRASLLGGGASLVRNCCYLDQRIEEQKRVVPGTTRHYDVTLDAIRNRLGSGPNLRNWHTLAERSFAVELGRLVTGQQDVMQTLRAMQTAASAHVSKFGGSV
ncbi:ABC transporter substrate-binding protein [Oceanidesulfovibrio indonesiensis]|nr:extracellular solute-binding protein [Oceanidesulfovibrio indonesiensis]